MLELPLEMVVDFQIESQAPGQSVLIENSDLRLVLESLVAFGGEVEGISIKRIADFRLIF